MQYRDQNLYFQVYPSLNLIAHTCNLLGIPLGGPGCREYLLRDNQKALDALGLGCCITLSRKIFIL